MSPTAFAGGQRTPDPGKEVAAPHLSLVVPAYNEERRLPASLRLIDEYLSGLPFASELILVDDGSTDATAAIARGFQPSSERVRARVLTHQSNRGKGAAVRTGCLAAEGEFVVFTDADLAAPLPEVRHILAALEAGADVAAGSRVHLAHQDMRRTQPAYRRAAGQLFTFVRRWLAVPEIQDTQCPLKGFRREAAQRLFVAQRLAGWAFDVEILYLTRRLGLRLVEVPVQWRHVSGSRLRTNPITGLRVLWDLLRMRWLHRRTGARS